MRKFLWLLLLLPLVLGSSLSAQAAETPTVHAVLFYSPSCPHCHDVIQNVLPPLFEQYGEQLQMIGIDTTVEQGQALYQAAIEQFQIPENRRGVPTLIIGSTVLVGSLEIPQQLPGLIEAGMQQGGIDYPEIPGLADLIAQLEAEQPAEAESPAETDSQPQAPANVTESAPPPPIAVEPSSDAPLWVRNFQQDVAANSLSVALLVVMLGCLGWSVWSVLRERAPKPLPQIRWLIPALCVAGIGVAAYMSFVETTGTAAFCGPVGNCNAVQQSAYATLFGVLPVGIFGLMGYAALLAAWAVVEFAADENLKKMAQLALWGFSLFGILFSIYLTFLEPFVIGATCLWCLSSATLITLLLWVSTPLAAQVWKTDDEDELTEARS